MATPQRKMNISESAQQSAEIRKQHDPEAFRKMGEKGGKARGLRTHRRPFAHEKLPREGLRSLDPLFGQLRWCSFFSNWTPHYLTRRARRTSSPTCHIS